MSGLLGADYLVYLHEVWGHYAGLPSDAITALGKGQVPASLSGDQWVAARFVQELVTTHRVSDASYAAGVAAFGQTGLTDLVNMVGSYLATSTSLAAFEVGIPEPVRLSPVPLTPSNPVPASQPVGDHGLGGRLPLVDLNTATAAQLELAARMKSTLPPPPVKLVSAEGRLIGPLNAYLYNPIIGRALFEVTAVAFASSGLPSSVREIAVLTVAGQWKTEFLLYAHRVWAAAAGVPDADIEAIAGRRTPVSLTGDELLAARFARELASAYLVGDELYDAAEAAFGRSGVVDLVNLIGVYIGMAALLNTFKVPAPPAP